MTGQRFFKHHHEPRAGYRHHMKVLKDLSSEVMRGWVGMLSIGSIMNIPMSDVIVNPSDGVKIDTSDMFPQVVMNKRPLGSASIPTELIRVHHEGRYFKVQMFYD